MKIHPGTGHLHGSYCCRKVKSDPVAGEANSKGKRPFNYEEDFLIEAFAGGFALAASAAHASSTIRFNMGIFSRISATTAETDVSHLAAKTLARW